MSYPINMSGENTYGQKTLVKLILDNSSRTVVEHLPNHFKANSLSLGVADGTMIRKRVKMGLFKSTK